MCAENTEGSKAEVCAMRNKGQTRFQLLIKERVDLACQME